MIMPSFFYYLIILACCCILLTIQIPNNMLLIPAIIAYGIATTLDISGTIRYKDRTICKHESSLSFGIFVKYLGRGGAILPQISIEVTLAWLVMPIILEHQSPSVPFLFLASIAHLYGFLNNITLKNLS